MAEDPRPKPKPAPRPRPAPKAKAAKAKAKVKAKAKAAPATATAEAAPKPKAPPTVKAQPAPLPKPPRPPIGLGTVITRPPGGFGGLITQPIITQPITGIAGPIISGLGDAVAEVPPAASIARPPLVRPVFLPDTGRFSATIRPNIWQNPDFIRPSKTVVVSQSPSPNDVVPMGTPVTVTTTVKQLLPLTGLDVLPTLVNSFRTAGDVEDLVVQAPEPVRTAVLGQTDYLLLGQSDRVVVDQFLNDNIPDAAALDENGRAQLFSDLRFVAQI